MGKPREFSPFPELWGQGIMGGLRSEEFWGLSPKNPEIQGRRWGQKFQLLRGCFGDASGTLRRRFGDASGTLRDALGMLWGDFGTTLVMHLGHFWAASERCALWNQAVSISKTNSVTRIVSLSSMVVKVSSLLHLCPHLMLGTVGS